MQLGKRGRTFWECKVEEKKVLPVGSFPKIYHICRYEKEDKLLGMLMGCLSFIQVLRFSL